MTAYGFAQKYKPRVPVPAETRRAIADLASEMGTLGALQFLGISRETFKDACVPGGVLRPEVLERIERKLGVR